jgi:hypothetical protein
MQIDADTCRQLRDLLTGQAWQRTADGKFSAASCAVLQNPAISAGLQIFA